MRFGNIMVAKIANQEPARMVHLNWHRLGSVRMILALRKLVDKFNWRCSSSLRALPRQLAHIRCSGSSTGCQSSATRNG